MGFCDELEVSADKVFALPCVAEKERLSSCGSTTVESECSPRLSWADSSDCARSLSELTDGATEAGDFFGLEHHVEADDVLGRLEAIYRPRDDESCSEDAPDSTATRGRLIRSKKRKSGWSRRREQNFWQSVREASPERWLEYHNHDGHSYIMLSCTVQSSVE